MKSYKHKTGVTLVEILVVAAIIAILVTMVIGIAARIDNQGKEQLTKNTIAILDAALGQFQNYGYDYKLAWGATDPQKKFYSSLDFPIDCNRLEYDELRTEWGRALGSTRGTTDIEILPSSAQHDRSYSGSEVMYFFLNRVPESRKTLDKIDRKLITNLGKDGKPMEIRIKIGGDFKYPLLRFIDPWGTTLRYDYYDETASFANDNRMKTKKTFPVIISAGPDKIFGTSDDISSR